MCSLCLPSTGDIGTLGAQFLSVNKDSHQLLQGGFLFYKGWSAWKLLFFVRGISSLDHEACQIHWIYYGTFLLPTLLPSSEPSLTDMLACVLFCRLLWDFFLYIWGPILCYNRLSVGSGLERPPWKLRLVFQGWFEQDHLRSLVIKAPTH